MGNSYNIWEDSAAYRLNRPAVGQKLYLLELQYKNTPQGRRKESVLRFVPRLGFMLGTLQACSESVGSSSPLAER